MNYMENKNTPNPWDLDAEAIVVKIRWFGVLIGYFLVNATDLSGDRRGLLNLILAIGVGYTLLDTYFSWKKKFSLPITLYLSQLWNRFSSAYFATMKRGSPALSVTTISFQFYVAHCDILGL